MNENRIGRFVVNHAMMQPPYEYLIAAQQGMAILHMEQVVWNGTVTYFAAGPMFDELPQGAATPEYTLKFNLTDDGGLVAEFTRIPYHQINKD